MAGQHADDGLGNLVKSHRVANGRRLRQAIILLVLGVIVGVAGVAVTRAYFEAINSSGFSPLPGALDGLALVLLVLGGLRLVQSLANRDERFDLYKNGFVHHSARGDRTVRWGDIASVRHLGQFRDGGIAHLLAVDYRCLVTLRDGSTVKFNTFTSDADVLGRAIDQRAKNAAQP